VLIFFFVFRPPAGAEEGRAQDPDLHLLLGLLLVLRAQIAGPEGVQVVGVAEEIRRGQDRPRRDLLGNILRRDIAKLRLSRCRATSSVPCLKERRVEERLDR